MFLNVSLRNFRPWNQAWQHLVCFIPSPTCFTLMNLDKASDCQGDLEGRKSEKVCSGKRRNPKDKTLCFTALNPKDCKRITLKLFTSIIWYSYKSSTFIQLTIRKFVKHPDARCWHSLSIQRIGAVMWLVITVCLTTSTHWFPYFESRDFWAINKLPSSAPSGWHAHPDKDMICRKGTLCFVHRNIPKYNSGSGCLRELIQSYRFAERSYKSHQEAASTSGVLIKSTTHHGNLRQLRKQNMKQDMTRWRKKRTMKRSDLSTTFADVEVNYHN